MRLVVRIWDWVRFAFFHLMRFAEGHRFGYWIKDWTCFLRAIVSVPLASDWNAAIGHRICWDSVRNLLSENAVGGVKRNLGSV